MSAPKGNSTIYNVLDTGAIYSCRLPVGGRVFGESISCQEIDVTAGLKSRTRKTVFGSHFIEDTMTRNMFLGSSISLAPDRNDVLTCGHLWTNEIRIRGYDSLNPSGRCWIFDAETERAIDTLLPFTVLGKHVCFGRLVMINELLIHSQKNKYATARTTSRTQRPASPPPTRRTDLPSCWAHPASSSGRGHL